MQGAMKCFPNTLVVLDSDFYRLFNCSLCRRFGEKIEPSEGRWPTTLLDENSAG